jgi:hypothetical protein
MLDVLSHQFQSCHINYIYAAISTEVERWPWLQNARIRQAFEAAYIIARRSP